MPDHDYAGLAERLDHMEKHIGDQYGAEVAHRAAAALRHAEKLQEIVGKLPVTADGVPVVPGVGTIWKWWHMGHGEYDLIQEVTPAAKHLIAAYYSTEEAGRADGPPTPKKNIRAARTQQGANDE